MSKTREIIKRRLNEKDDTHKGPDHEPVHRWDPDHENPFDTWYTKAIQKIDKKPASARIKLYKALLGNMVEPMATSGANKTKLTKAVKDFLKDFDKHLKDK